MSTGVRELMPPEKTSLRDLELVTHVPDPDIRRQASRILINRHHALLGGINGPLGLPMPVSPVLGGGPPPLRDLRSNGSGGFIKPFSGGAIEMNDFVNGPQGIQKFRAEVKFVGYRVVDTNDHSADEPYFIINVTGTNQAENTNVRTNIADGSVKADNIVFLEQMITTTAQPPFVLSVTGMDHDSGNPDEAAAKVTKAIND